MNNKLRNKLYKILICALSISSININSLLISKESSPKEVSINIDNIDQINSLFSKTIGQLDQLGSIIQYLGQAINKNKINPTYPEIANKWISNALKSINKLENIPVNINKSYILKLNLATSYLINQTYKNIDNNFSTINYSQLKELNIDNIDLAKFKGPVSLGNISNLLNLNKDLLNKLNLKSTEAGLSNINKVTRMLDKINDQYKITKILTGLSLGTGLAITLSYLAPKITLDASYTKLNWLLSPIVKLKQYVGEKPSYKKEDGTLANPKELKTIGQLDHIFYRNKDIQKLLGVSGFAASWYFGKEIKESLSSVKRSIANQWEYLKGYDLIDNSKNRNTYQIEETLTLDDERLIGLEEQAEQLKKTAYYVVEPDIYDKQGVGVGKGILLTGPTRTGKTLLARAMAGTINQMLKDKGINKKFGFKEVKFGELVWREDAIERLLTEAKNNAPCILFIDELHNLPLQSNDANSVLNNFLTGMSGINSESDAKHQVIMLAATNKPELLDAALLQPGRFGNIIHFNRPNFENRKKYFETMLKRNMFDSSEFNLDIIAQQTQGCSYGDLEEVLREARFNARRESKKLNQKHLQDKINYHVHRLKENLPLTNKEKNIVSAYQAGKILAYNLLNPAEELLLVTIKGREPKIKERHFLQNVGEKNNIKEHEESKKIEYGHIITYNSQESLGVKDKNYSLTEAKILLAGEIAQSILLKSTYPDYKPEDKLKAINNIKSYLLNNMNEQDLPKEEKDKLKIKTFTLINKYQKDITSLLTKHKNKLNKFYEQLKIKVTLDQEDIKHL